MEQISSSRARRAAATIFRLLIYVLVGFMVVAVGTAPALAWTVYLPLVANQSSPVNHSKPQTSASYYILSSDPNRAYSAGCQQGLADARTSPPTNSLVVLDFGGQFADGSGSLLIGTALKVTNAQIEAIAEAFAHGYWYCTGSDYSSVLTLVIGTNNSYYDVNYNGGQTWARIVADVAAYDQSKGYAAQVVAEGGNDMEPAWADVTSSRAWVDGFASLGSAFDFDYGSADSCSTSSYLNGSCANGWSQSDVWYVSWGASAARALPEIYYANNAAQWTMLALYGAEFHGSSGSISFSGPLDTYPLWTSSNTADQAWQQLLNDLNGYGETSTQPLYLYSTEMNDEP